MKQGSATHSGSGATKPETKPTAVSPAAVSRIGIAQSPTTQPVQMYQGRGLKAPMVGSTSHPSGSQGKH